MFYVIIICLEVVGSMFSSKMVYEFLINRTPFLLFFNSCACHRHVVIMNTNSLIMIHKGVVPSKNFQGALKFETSKPFSHFLSIVNKIHKFR